ncbi:MAG: GTPase HflX [Gemmataceae bacterium]
MSFDNTRKELKVDQERAFLVSVDLPERPWVTQDPLEEITGLVTTAGATVVGGLLQRRQDIHPGTFIGKGKLDQLIYEAGSVDADVIVFDNDLTPAQVRNLEKATERKVLDRSEIILDIFATRARSVEARLQVELAQLEYSLPRLKQMWTHLSRQEGGGIGLRGPGETQLEVDRRLVAYRIRDLKEKIRIVQARKEREVASRSDEYTVSLVGYTNAGKSTLMKALTGADIKVANQLFSTLDTRTRQWQIPEFGKVLLSDTVGFIRDLPHHLIASFKATLEEARQARLLLHVVDASDPLAEDHIQAVKGVLKELGCEDKPTLLVFNKADKVEDISLLDVLDSRFPDTIHISAARRKGIEELCEAVVTKLTSNFVETEVNASAGNGRVIAFLSAHAEIYHQEYEGDRVQIGCYIPRHLIHHIHEPGVQIQVRLDDGTLGPYRNGDGAE